MRSQIDLSICLDTSQHITYVIKHSGRCEATNLLNSRWIEPHMNFKDVTTTWAPHTINRSPWLLSSHGGVRCPVRVPTSIDRAKRAQFRFLRPLLLLATALSMQHVPRVLIVFVNHPSPDQWLRGCISGRLTHFTSHCFSVSLTGVLTCKLLEQR